MGFDIEYIPNSQSLPLEYFCSLCQLLIDPNEVLQSICTHLYCKPCLAYVASTTMACPYDGYLVTKTHAKPLVQSNQVLADTIGKIVVCCLYQTSGCTWLGSLSESSSHCSGCGFGNSLVVCNLCGIQVVHRQGQEHLQVCPGLQQLYTSIQPQLQSQSLALHQPHVFPSASHLGAAWLPQAYPSVSPHPQDSSHTFSASQAHAHSQTTSLSQAHHLQNPQVPQHQLQIQNPMHPQANSVQTSLPHDTIGQGQSHQLHAHWNGQKTYPQPNQTNHQVGFSPNNMPMNYQVGMQSPQVPHVLPPHSLPTMQTQQPSLPSHLTRAQYVKQLVRKYGRAPVSKSSVMQAESDQQVDLGKSHVVEKQGIEDDPSLNGTPLINPASLESVRLANLNIVISQYLKTINVDSDDVQRSRADSLGSLDRARFDQRSPIRPHENHEPDFGSRPTSRLSQPLTGFGERQFRRGPTTPVSEHLGMCSHGPGPLAHELWGNRVGTTDIEGMYRLHLPRSDEFRGHGNNIQMGYADMIGPVDVPNHIRGGELIKEGAGFDGNALRPGDIGFRSRYTLQGFPGDARSFPEDDVGPFPNSRKRAAWHVEGLDLHSQSKKPKTAHDHANSSSFGYPNKNEESRFRG